MSTAKKNDPKPEYFFEPSSIFFGGIAKNKEKQKITRSPPLSLFSLHGNGDTIRIGQEIQCLQYAGFFVCIWKIIALLAYF